MHLKSQKKTDLEGCQPHTGLGWEPAGDAYHRGLYAVPPQRNFGEETGKHSLNRSHHTAFFSVEFFYNCTDETSPHDLFSGTSAGLTRQVNYGEGMLCTFLFKLKTYLLQKILFSCPYVGFVLFCFILILQTRI